MAPMNDTGSRFNDRPAMSYNRAMTTELPDMLANEVRPLIWRAAGTSILVFWAFQYTYMSALRFIRIPGEGVSLLLPRGVVTLVAVVLSCGIVAIHIATARRALWQKAIIAVIAAALGAFLHSLVNYIVFAHIFFVGGRGTVSESLLTAFDLWCYIALSVMILAVTFWVNLRDRERRMAVLAAEAHSAQIRALRYQLNPHFLFNTLNSVAALVSRRQNATAERMIENLSDFLRSGLALDPHDDIRLSDELALHSVYLEIERMRFPGRLKIDIDVPPELMGAMVPSLITQPLIENAVKYAVARSSVPVHLLIAARSEDGQLHLTVADDGGDAPPAAPSGMRIGLSNVEARLRARFGNKCAFSMGPRPEGGFAVALFLPLSLDSGQ
jgi:two-component system, LytTR family, sensor kinase